MGWVFHEDHGWVYPSLATDGSLWFYDADMQDWLWTSSSVYLAGQTHFLYSSVGQAWLYHSPDTVNPRWFYHYAIGKWIEATTFEVTVEASAGGSVSGAGTYSNGSTVTLTATASSGYEFTGWGGGASGSSSTITLTVDSAKNVTATFQQDAATTSQEAIEAIFR